MKKCEVGRELLHPLPLAAVVLLIANDHVLKGSGLLPGWVTGKLSDLAGLFFFPIALFVAVDAVTRGGASRRRARAAIAVSAATAVGFCLLKLSPPLNAWVASAWGPNVLDPSDLLALPCAAAAAIWLLAPRCARPSPALLRLAAFALTALATMATSRPMMVRNYPAWQIEGLGARQLDCAIVDLWVSKSGKQGLGVTLELTPTASSCRVSVEEARFSADGVEERAARLPAPRVVERRDHLYLPFAFDNEALWNDEVRDGRLDLWIRVGEASERLAFRLRHVWHAAHRIDREKAP